MSEPARAVATLPANIEKRTGSSLREPAVIVEAFRHSCDGAA